MVHRCFVLTVLLLGLLLACCGDQAERDLGVCNQSITYGDPDTSQAHMAVVALDLAGGMCSGTLIHDRVVMTAAHCVDNVSTYNINVGFGSNIYGSMSWVGVSAKWVHPQWDAQRTEYDIALVRLSQSVSVTPIPNLPSSLRLKDPDDIGISIEFVGFGQTETGGIGRKETVTADLTWICDSDQGCLIDGTRGWWANPYTICTDQSPGGPCGGDSGGPAFIWRSGKEYTAGVTSYGINESCTLFGCSTKVDRFQPEILAFIGEGNGAVCSTGSQCDSGICEDGVCCNTTCAGDCRICNMLDSLGICTNAPNGYACPDNDRCDGIETCQNGVCTEGPPTDCDDHNMCTADSCITSIGCRHSPEPDGTLCSDDNICNGVETCGGGLCHRPDPLNCDDHNGCTTDSCDRVEGCMHTTLADGTSCDDSLACNGTDVCQGGECTHSGGPECDDGNPCTADQCTDGGGCEYTPYPPGTQCNDGSRCTQNDTCTAGVCSGQPVDCDDQNPCTADVCDPQSGCAHTQLADGTGCGGGQCGQAVCVQGVCEPVSGSSCDDHDPCTEDLCDPVQGCTHNALPDGWECGECYLCIGGQCMKATDCGKSGGCSSAGGPGGLSLLAGLLVMVLWGRGRRRLR